MSRKRTNKYFHIGKNINKNDSLLTPMHGYPNTNLDTYHKESGKLKSRRKFDNNGDFLKDLDVADKHKTFDHVHENIDGKRSNDRLPNKNEKQELIKAKEKRKFWNNGKK